MSKNYLFKSVFAPLIIRYIEMKRDQGYQFDLQSYSLFKFDEFCSTQSISQPIITRELFNQWAESIPSKSGTGYNKLLGDVNRFSLYLNCLGYDSYVTRLLPQTPKTIPYLMNDDDIHAFFNVLDSYEAKQSPMKVIADRMTTEYQVLFRLIVCCGLRNNEACSLKFEDIDTDTGIVTIQHSKGDKDRLIYLSEDLRQLCDAYKKWIIKKNCGVPEWFFPGHPMSKHIPKTSVCAKFNKIWSRTENSTHCDKKPTVHGLRYYFVIKRMNLWMENNVDFKTHMPYLSSYLGHKSPAETYYYFYQTEEAFETVRKKDIKSSYLIPEVNNNDKKQNKL